MTDLDTLARHAGQVTRDEARSRARHLSAPTTPAPNRRPLALVALAVIAVVVIVATDQLWPGRQLVIEPAAPGTDQPGPADPKAAPEAGFVPTDRLPDACFWCTATLLEDGRVLVVGEPLGAALYDPMAEEFTMTGPPVGEHGEGAAARLADGRVLVIAGFSPTPGQTPAIEIYDPGTGGFSAVADTSELRRIAGAGDAFTPIVLEDGRVLVIGGAGVVSFDPDTHEFGPTVPAAEPRPPGATATLLDDGRVLIVGSEAPGGLYDPDTESFSATAPTTIASGATATRLADGRVLFVGGTSSSDHEPLATAELFDPATGTFTPTGTMSTARAGHTTALLADGRVLVIGGWDDTAATTAELFDPATERFSPAPAPTASRRAATAVSLSDGRVLVLGHYPGNVPRSTEDPADTAEIFTVAGEP